VNRAAVAPLLGPPDFTADALFSEPREYLTLIHFYLRVHGVLCWLFLWERMVSICRWFRKQAVPRRKLGSIDRDEKERSAMTLTPWSRRQRYDLENISTGLAQPAKRWL